MRDVAIYSNAIAEPGVCAKCGSQAKDWFVDLGFDLDMNRPFNVEMDSSETPVQSYNLWFDGVVYLCCDCFNNLVIDAQRLYEEFKNTHNIGVELHGSTGDSAFDESEQDDSGDVEDYSGTDPDDPGIVETSEDSEPSLGFSLSV